MPLLKLKPMALVSEVGYVPVSTWTSSIFLMKFARSLRAVVSLALFWMLLYATTVMATKIAMITMTMKKFNNGKTWLFLFCLHYRYKYIRNTEKLKRSLRIYVGTRTTLHHCVLPERWRALALHSSHTCHSACRAR